MLLDIINYLGIDSEIGKATVVVAAFLISIIFCLLLSGFISWALFRGKKWQD